MIRAWRLHRLFSRCQWCSRTGVVIHVRFPHMTRRLCAECLLGASSTAQKSGLVMDHNQGAK
jgi:hypothetical protein